MSNVNTYNIKYNNPAIQKGTAINVYYINNPLDTCDIYYISQGLRELYNTWEKWIGIGCFDGLTLNIYDNSDPEIPTAISHYSGLTYAWEKRI